MIVTRNALLATMMLAATTPLAAQGPLPRIERTSGQGGDHHALIVDGAPFLMLGAQVNNSSNYPAALPKVWPVLDTLGANTVEVPVAWQQIEPVEGRFDLSWVQVLLDQARTHDKRLVLLWFGTWKNTGPGYQPDWVKLDNRRFPRMKTRAGADGETHSPLAAATLEADKRAFVQLMTYLRDHDPQNTVIMVQVENETGSYQNPRDYSPAADRLFAQGVPAALAKAMNKPAGTSWAAAFGRQADRAFNSWHTARFVEAVAVAGKAVKPLPMYVNASLAGPTNDPDPMGAASGGPQQDMVTVWKAAAPHIDVEAPDIYTRKSADVIAYLDAFRRPDNALMVPEIGNGLDYARYFWAAIGRGAIGFSPFGMDDTGYFNFPLGATALDDGTLAAFARAYRPFAGGMAREWARIAATRPTWGVAKPDDGAAQTVDMGDWTITANWGQWQFGEKKWFPDAPPPPWAAKPIGGAVVAQLSPNEFLLTGDHVRLSIGGRKGGAAHGVMLRVEEGHMADGRWVTERVWNGDQTDYGLNLIDHPVWLKVTMAHYR